MVCGPLDRERELGIRRNATRRDQPDPRPRLAVCPVDRGFHGWDFRRASVHNLAIGVREKPLTFPASRKMPLFEQKWQSSFVGKSSLLDRISRIFRIDFNQLNVERKILPRQRVIGVERDRRVRRIDDDRGHRLAVRRLHL